MCANWEIWMFDNDGPNQIHAAMKRLDKEMGPFIEESSFRYDLETILGGTTCFKSYINFYSNQGEDSVRVILPGFSVNPINCLDDIEICHFFSNHCYTGPNGDLGSLSQVIITLYSLWSVTSMK